MNDNVPQPAPAVKPDLPPSLARGQVARDARAQERQFWPRGRGWKRPKSAPRPQTKTWWRVYWRYGDWRPSERWRYRTFRAASRAQDFILYIKDGETHWSRACVRVKKALVRIGRWTDAGGEL